MTEGKKWYNLTVNEVLESLNSSPQCLSHEGARKRLEQFGMSWRKKGRYLHGLFPMMLNRGKIKP